MNEPIKRGPGRPRKYPLPVPEIEESQPNPVTSTRDNLRVLLAQIPTEIFVNMVAKSGMAVGPARELCAIFKELKA